jgi:hypothetical protein
MGESCQVVKREKNKGLAVPILTENLSNTIIQALLCFQTQVASLEKVKKVAYRPKGQVITIWTYALPDDATLENIYAIELRLIEMFPDLTFDFTVIFDVDSDIPTGFIPAGIV